MKDQANWIVGLLVAVALVFALVVNLVVFPYLLMLALGALGYEVSFLVSLAFWVLTVFVLNYIKNIFKK